MKKSVIQKVRNLFSVMVMVMLLGINFVSAHAAEWIYINGNVTAENGTPLCAMVIANGQNMFSCDPAGEYELNVPLNNYGEIVLYSFVDGCKPFKMTLAPTGAVSFDITMTASDGTEPIINLTTEFGVAEINPAWIKISGYVMADEDGTPLCAMLLANGQHMFTCNSVGEYELEVPINGSGQLTIFAFVEGFRPFRQTLDIGI